MAEKWLKLTTTIFWLLSSIDVENQPTNYNFLGPELNWRRELQLWPAANYFLSSSSTDVENLRTAQFYCFISTSYIHHGWILNVSWAQESENSSQRQLSSRSTLLVVVLNVSWAPGQNSQRQLSWWVRKLVGSWFSTTVELEFNIVLSLSSTLSVRPFSTSVEVTLGIVVVLNI